MENDFELPQVYRALDQFDGFFYELQQYIHEKVESIVGRKLEYSFYDVTNYYTEKTLRIRMKHTGTGMEIW